MNHPAKILVIIPCYNEEANIVSTVERLRATCPQVDFLIINDCSTDRSAELLAEHGYPFLDLPVNLGIGGGVQCGYRYARANGYDVAVQMDGDGQHDPAYLMQIVQPVLDGKLDMCIGSRFIKCEGFQTSFMRRVGIRFLSWLIHISLCSAHSGCHQWFPCHRSPANRLFCGALCFGLSGAGSHSGCHAGRVPRRRSPGRHERTSGRRFQHSQF